MIERGQPQILGRAQPTRSIGDDMRRPITLQTMGYLTAVIDYQEVGLSIFDRGWWLATPENVLNMAQKFAHSLGNVPEANNRLQSSFAGLIHSLFAFDRRSASFPSMFFPVLLAEPPLETLRARVSPIRVIGSKSIFPPCHRLDMYREAPSCSSSRALESAGFCGLNLFHLTPLQIIRVV